MNRSTLDLLDSFFGLKQIEICCLLLVEKIFSHLIELPQYLIVVFGEASLTSSRIVGIWISTAASCIVILATGKIN